jgi:glycosyltransferase involved in cell wall biosynthesis
MVKMKIAYVGDFLNHGKALVPIGTSIVFLLSMMEEVESIDVYCPMENERIEPITLPPKIRVIETYRYDKALSLMKLLRIKRYSYDKVIFNLLPTAFGNSSITNVFGISIPIILAKLLRMHNIEIVYHNSVFTNDIKKLGYTSIYDRFRSEILKIIEASIFKSIQTFVLLRIYKDQIHNALKNDKVKYLNAEYLEAVATVFVNNIQNMGVIKVERDKRIPTVLLHGSWGPQKNIDLGVETLDGIRKDGLSFNLIITGGINHHFPGYEKHFREILDRYNFSGCYKGPVTERGIFPLFTTSDLLLLPYNTPGGHSGVLEQAKFFEIPTIAIDFPEYREQAEGVRTVTLVISENFYDAVRDFILSASRADRISIREKLDFTLENMKILTNGGL